MRAIEFLSEDDTPRIRLGGDTSKAKAWIQKVYDLYPGTWQNNHVMTWGEGDDQQFCMFELVPSMVRPNAVEVKWFQAYPLRGGVGTRGMQELQRLAKEDGIGLTLFPWDKGQVSQGKLMKFYKGQGFQPNKPGSKNMYWSPEINEEIQPNLDVDYYMNEGCGIFAVAMALNIPSSQLYVISNKYGESWSSTFPYEITHVFVAVPNTGQYDVKGKRSPSQMANDFRLSDNDYKILGPFNPIDFLRKFMGDSDSKPLYGTMSDVKQLQMQLKSNPEVDEAVLDPHGWGAVPQSIDVDYFGLQVKMRPSMFLKLARPLDDAGVNPEVAAHMEKGGKIAYPWLDIAEPVEWEQGDFSKDAKVRKHEGRNRMHKWIKMKGDDPIQVNIFFKNANRRKYITPEMIEKLSQGAFNETGQWVNGPLFDPKTAQ